MIDGTHRSVRFDGELLHRRDLEVGAPIIEQQTGVPR